MHEQTRSERECELSQVEEGDLARSEEGAYNTASFPCIVSRVVPWGQPVATRPEGQNAIVPVGSLLSAPKQEYRYSGISASFARLLRTSNSVQ